MQVIRNRLNSVVLVLIALMLAGALARGVLGGPLDPQAPPGSTMKTLDQVEARSPIPPAGWDGTTFPITISQPGSYYLTGDITGAPGAHGIAITANDVTLDLNGFTLAGVAGSNDGIYSTGWNTTVLNGSIIGFGWVGLHTAVANAHATRLQVRSNGGGGIFLDGGQGSTVEDCTVTNNGFEGLAVTGNGIVRGNTVAANDGLGIYAYGNGVTVDGNSVTSNNGEGIIADTVRGVVRGNSVSSNAGVGIHVYGPGATIDNNAVTGNGGGGILAEGQMSRIEANDVSGILLISIPFGIRVTGTHNIVVRNSATYNLDNFDIAAGNTAGPEETSAATSPWSNVNY